MDPEGILNGSTINDLINPAIINAQNKAFKLLMIDFLNLLNDYGRYR